MDGVVKVKIEVNNGGDTSTADSGKTSTDKQPKNKQSQSNAKTAFAVERAVSVARQLGTQVVNNGIQYIGYTTGNLVWQRNAERAMSITTKLVSIGTSFAANTILGGIALVSTGIDKAFEIAQRNREIQWANRSAMEMQRRAGFAGNNNR